MSRIVPALTGTDDDPPDPQDLTDAESSVRGSLARIRAVVESAEALELQSFEGGHTNRALWPSLSALTADDRRLLGMDR